MYSILFIKQLLLIFISILFISCGGSSSSDENVEVISTPQTTNNSENLSKYKVGIFIDDVVEGIGYTKDSNMSFTNENGEFFYKDNEEIEFFIGDISIGKVSNVNDDKNVYLQDVLDINRSIVNNDKLILIATFLQSLDANKTDSKIQITKDDFNKFKDGYKKINDINISDILVQKGFSVKEKHNVIKHLQNVNVKYSFNDSEKKYLDELFKTEYLWNNEINISDYSKFTKPNDMIESYKYKKLDKWSFAQTFDDFESFSAQITDGFGCKISSNFIYQVQLNSPCDEAGLQRGDLIIKINDINFSKDIYDKYSSDINTSSSFIINRYDYINDKYNELNTSITAKKFTYNVVKHKIFDNNTSSTKVAYLRYDSFSEKSTIELDNAFKYFKENNANELIIDLRDNLGGSLYMSSYLLDYIIDDRDNELQFYAKFNDSNIKKNFHYAFFDRNTSLSLSKVIFLTSSNTASASETVINSLKPFLNVVTIGSKTNGKPTGMYGRNLGEKFMYFLINFSIYNAQDEGDYYSGINATKDVYDYFDTKLGDKTESLLASALYYTQHGNFANDFNTSLENNFYDMP